MSALPNRILRLLVEQPLTQTADSVRQHFAAYSTLHVGKTIARLQRLGLVVSDERGRMQCTTSGQLAVAMPHPPRWSAQRRSSPHTATIA
jgi:hypothetical protein